LFHYRNHGAAFGKVLMGLQIEPAEQADFHACLNALGFGYYEETNNPAYRLFSGGQKR
jgi:threonine dehydratase